MAGMLPATQDSLTGTASHRTKSNFKRFEDWVFLFKSVWTHVRGILRKGTSQYRTPYGAGPLRQSSKALVRDDSDEVAL